MKKIFVLLTLFLMVSCAYKDKRYTETPEDKLNAAIKIAENSEITETKLFLDFQFGMTEKEAQNHVSQLVRDGKFKLNSKGKYAHSFTTNRGRECEILAAPSYHDGKLYKIIYVIVSNTVVIHYDMSETFGESERGRDFDEYQTKNVLDERIFTFVKDNLVSTFRESGLFEARMIYENAPVAKLVREEEERQKREDAQKSSAEF